jgi:zinc protease
MTGATHYLEHMMFKGAKKFGPEKFSKTIEQSGGDSNAYTSYDNTVYFESLPREALSLVLDLEADRMQDLVLEEKSFANEKNVVLEERKMRYENSPNGKLFLSMMTSMFEGTPYGETVIGRVEDIKSYTIAAVHDYYKSYYAPNNAIMVIVGDVEADKVFDLVEKKFGSIPASKKVEELRKEKDKAELFAKADPAENKVKEVHIKGPSETPLFFLSYLSVPTNHPDRYILDLLSAILSEGESSYWIQKYVNGVGNKKPLLASIGVGNYNLDFHGVFMVQGELLKGMRADEFKKIILKNAKEEMCKEAITPRSLAKAKNQFFVHYFDGIKSNAGLAQMLGQIETSTGDFENYKEEIFKTEKVSLEDVKRVCEEYFVKREPSFFTLWAENK